MVETGIGKRRFDNQAGAVKLETGGSTCGQGSGPHWMHAALLLASVARRDGNAAALLLL